MIFEKLTVQNFLSIRDIKLDLENQGLTLINGINKDNESLNNNGSGKSSLIESIVYAIYARTLRGVKGDAVVNRVSKKNMKIFLDFVDDDGVEYRIARYRKHNVNKNHSFLYRNGTDITPKSEADFNDAVADLLQMDYLTFTSSILYSAESFKFTSATDAEMKTTFDTMLGLDVFTKCLEIAKNKLKDLESELSTNEWKMDTLSGKITEIESEILEAEESKEEYEEERAERLRLLDNSMKSLIKELKGQQEEKKALEDSVVSLEKKAKDSEARYKAVKKKMSQIDQLKQVVRENESEIKATEREIASQVKEQSRLAKQIERQVADKEDLQKNIESYKKNQKALDEKVGQPCPTCGQPMTVDSVEPAKEEYDRKIECAEKYIKECDDEIKRLEKESSKISNEIQELNEKCYVLNDEKSTYEVLIERSKNIIEEEEESSNEVLESKEEYLKAKSSLGVMDVKLESIQSNLERAESDYEKYKSEKNPYEGMIESYRSQIKKNQEQIYEIKNGVQDKLDEKECLMFWQQAYSNQGIKSYILDDITPFLNRRVNKYLKKLASNHIEVKFSTQTQLKSGEMREKFSIEINNEDGGAEYTSNSSGERRRIDLAVNLALTDLVASRSTKKVNIAIFDEAFDALDNVGVERVMELLQELSEEKSSVFVISHNSHLKSYFDNIITIVKQNGCSRLANSKDLEDEEDDD